mmetsp:Transcript_2463/g.3501  ORF Transcript_2463/g.3501 Transcript_2463/m.3501 type:complete len:91 (+) Transcript_2463:874-1146(+)
MNPNDCSGGKHIPINVFTDDSTNSNAEKSSSFKSIEMISTSTFLLLNFGASDWNVSKVGDFDSQQTQTMELPGFASKYFSNSSLIIVACL